MKFLLLSISLLLSGAVAVFADDNTKSLTDSFDEVTISKGTETASVTSTMPAPKEKKKKKKKTVKYNENGEIIKTGTNFGPLPVVAFDNDRGFQFGALLNIYNFGDGSTYPNPKSYWYIEASAYVKEGKIGTQTYYLEYDNKEIFKNTRLSAGISFKKDDALDFYGFNGYQSSYYINNDAELVDNGDSQGYTAYKFDDSKAGQKLQKKFDEKGKLPSALYRHSRIMLKAKVDFTGKILKNFYWQAGYHFHWIDIKEYNPIGYSIYSSNNVQRASSLNLYDLYKEWGIIPTGDGKKYSRSNQANGGFSSAIRAGLVYDSRDAENYPTKGIWTDFHLIMAPKFLGTTHEYYRIGATFRHYVPIWKDKLIFAYRLTYQGILNNDAPWYMMPFYTYMGKTNDYDGIGGYRSVRGLMLNKLQGQHVMFGNVEFRWRFIDFKLWNQNISFALSAFCDGGSVLGGFDLKTYDSVSAHLDRNEEFSEAYKQESLRLYNHFVDKSKRDGFHGSAGAGLRFIMNKNFIIAFEYAHCFNKQDGKGAFYLNTGFLF